MRFNEAVEMNCLMRKIPHQPAIEKSSYADSMLINAICLDKLLKLYGAVDGLLKVFAST